MTLALRWQDGLVVLAYVAALAGMGWHFARKQRSGDEYFLAGRSLPWLAVGTSIIATLLSSLTYLSEPGEVWQSGVTTLLGKLWAILTEMVVVLLVVIPFLMRFRFLSAYEYLGHRFGQRARRLGVTLFVCLVVSWMGFVVLAMSRAVESVSGVPLELVVLFVGGVGTVYTMAGGIRAVIWKEVLQVVLMVGGCFVCLAYVSWASGGTWLPDWVEAALAYRARREGSATTLVSFDPFRRISVFTFGLTMFVWHLCTHVGNQMVIQRYFSCHDLKAARRSFATAASLSVLINSLLVFVGLALIYFYTKGLGQLPAEPTDKKAADMIFPQFLVRELPPGLAGAVLTAVLSAAMSTIDSGINAIATVLSAERDRPHGADLGAPPRGGAEQVRFARLVTFAAGSAITLSAYGLDRLTADRNILEMMPRSFNCFLVPLGTMFLLGMFAPRVGARAAVAGALVALLSAVSIAYARELYGTRELSFTWVLPGALGLGILTGLLLSFFDRARAAQTAGLTWFSRHELPLIDHRLFADWVIEEARRRKAT
jgi:SSS family solute:Na+ symporter